MRIEAHLILWVTAAAIVAASVLISLGGQSELNSLTSFSTQSGPTAATTDQQQSSIPASTEPIVLPEMNASARNIFPESPVAAVPEPVAVAAPDAPLLTGIFSSSGERTAMISGAAGAAPALAREGDTVGNFVVVRIMPDKVVLRGTTDGAERVVLLRGTGELP